MNKIDKALKLIYTRLPSTYPRVGIKVYKTTKGLLLAEAKAVEATFKELTDWYDEYKQQDRYKKQKYISTKYFQPNHKKTNTWKDILMLAGDPICISNENVKQMSFEHTVFVLLHEIGHLYNKRTNNYKNEKMADEFAIRWVRVFIKEGLIMDYT